MIIPNAYLNEVGCEIISSFLHWGPVRSVGMYNLCDTGSYVNVLRLVWYLEIGRICSGILSSWHVVWLDSICQP